MGGVNGLLTAIYEFDDKISRHEIFYVHLQKRRMNNKVEDVTNYIIYDSIFENIKHSEEQLSDWIKQHTPKDIINLRKIPIYWWKFKVIVLKLPGLKIYRWRKNKAFRDYEKHGKRLRLLNVIRE